MKLVFTFLSVFLFAQICGIYIMGGFDHQTIYSKAASVSLGVVFGIAAIYVKHELDKSK